MSNPEGSFPEHQDLEDNCQNERPPVFVRNKIIEDSFREIGSSGAGGGFNYDHSLIDDISKDSEGDQKSTDRFRKPPDKDFLLEPVTVNPKFKCPSVVLDMIISATAGLAKGKCPIMSPDGTGGTYFMQAASGCKNVAVFKPIDEEPKAVNNPRGLPVSSNGEGLKRGTKVGEGARREEAAYLLDRPINGCRNRMGFADVPPTVMVKCLHKGFNHPEGYDGGEKNIKMGSLQMFINNSGSCENWGPKDFPVEEVHKISVFDIRTANADRHAGNILVSREGEELRIVLIPIDHGYCLPESFEDCTFDWLYWPQAKQPFSTETIDYIKSLDAEKDIALLKSYGWELSRECARTFRISTMLLKKGAERGLTPFEIGTIMCRETLNKEFVLEDIFRGISMLPGMSEIGTIMCRETLNKEFVLEDIVRGISMLPGMSETAFTETVSQIMDYVCIYVKSKLAVHIDGLRMNGTKGDDLYCCHRS